jgi:hypothetical protein
MSGLDEQLEDFPPCSYCKEGKYWYVDGHSSSIDLTGVCLNPDSYLKRMSRGAYKVNNALEREATEDDLDFIEIIRCENCDKSVPEHDMHKFIALAKKYLYTRRL